MSGPWDKYGGGTATADGPWSKYSGEPERHTESPIPAPKLQRPQPDMKEVYLLGGEPTQPGLKTFDEMAKGAAQTTGYMAAAAPTVMHRVAQRVGAAKPGDAFPGEHTVEQVRQEDYPNMVATVAGGYEGADRPPSAAPRGRTVPEPPRTAETLPPEHVAAIEKANRGFLDAKAQIERKQGLEQTSKKFVEQAHDNIQQTYKAGRGALDQRWGQFRTGMEGTQLDASDAFNNIEAAKAKYLKGSPASLQVFNNLVKEMGIQEFMEGPKGELTAIKGAGELPFDTARVHYSAIGDKLAQGGLPGNVYQALKAVEEGLDKQLTKGAEGRGLGKEYGALKADESQFRRDWVDSDSPLAKAHKALDPNFLRPRLLGPGNEYITKQLGRYKQYGANPSLPAAAKHFADQVKELPTKKLAEVKGLPEPKTPRPQAGKMTKAIGRLTGKIVGGTIGSKVGHPLIGYGIGGEVGGDLAERIATKRRTVTPPPE